MEKYVQSLINTPGPILPSQQPQTKLNLRGLMEYAKSVGKKVSELKEEKKQIYFEESGMVNNENLEIVIQYFKTKK